MSTNGVAFFNNVIDLINRAHGLGRLEEAMVKDEWIQVPAHRVLRMTFNRFNADFERVNPDVVLIEPGEPGGPHFRKKTDGTLFQVPRYHRMQDDMNHVLYLEAFVSSPAAEYLCSLCHQPVRQGRCACV